MTDVDLLWEQLSMEPEFIETRKKDYQQFIDNFEQPQPKKEPLWKTYLKEGLKDLNEGHKKRFN
jgi:hypothetical protein